MPKPAKWVRDSRPGQKSRPRNPGVGADLQRLGVPWVAARERDQSSGAIELRKLAALPARRSTALTGKQPDLKQLEGNLATIALGMSNPRPGAHDLNVARQGAAYVAGAILIVTKPCRTYVMISMSACGWRPKPVPGAISSSFHTTRAPSGPFAGLPSADTTK